MMRMRLNRCGRHPVRNGQTDTETDRQRSTQGPRQKDGYTESLTVEIQTYVGVGGDQASTALTR